MQIQVLWLRLNPKTLLNTAVQVKWPDLNFKKNLNVKHGRMVDIHKELRLSALLILFQETARVHCQKFPISPE